MLSVPFCFVPGQMLTGHVIGAGLRTISPDSFELQSTWEKNHIHIFDVVSFSKTFLEAILAFKGRGQGKIKTKHKRVSSKYFG